MNFHGSFCLKNERSAFQFQTKRTISLDFIVALVQAALILAMFFYFSRSFALFCDKIVLDFENEE